MDGGSSSRDTASVLARGPTSTAVTSISTHQHVRRVTPVPASHLYCSRTHTTQPLYRPPVQLLAGGPAEHALYLHQHVCLVALVLPRLCTAPMHVPPTCTAARWRARKACSLSPPACAPCCICTAPGYVLLTCMYRPPVQLLAGGPAERALYLHQHVRLVAQDLVALPRTHAAEGVVHDGHLSGGGGRHTTTITG